MSQDNKIGIEIIPNSWCHTARPVRLLGVHGVIIVPILLSIMHLRLWTLYVLIAIAGILVLVERQGYSPRVCWLLIRGRLSGNRVSNTRRVGSRRLWRR